VGDTVLSRTQRAHTHAGRDHLYAVSVIAHLDSPECMYVKAMDGHFSCCKDRQSPGAQLQLDAPPV
jgi:hypothetical protein